MINHNTESKVFILNGGPMTPNAQKDLLEMHQHIVELKDVENIRTGDVFAKQDIVFMDVGFHTPQNFSALDSILKNIVRPKILITTFKNQVFQQDDQLGDAPSCVLFKPFQPSDLLAAVQSLKGAW